MVWDLGSRRLPADRCVLIVKLTALGPSLRFIGGGKSSADEATIGAAKASGDEMDDGVDERVGILLNACQSVGVGATVGGGGGGAGGGGEGEKEAGVGVGELVIEGRFVSLKGSNMLERLLLGAMECDEEAIGVGSDDGASPVTTYPECALARSSSAFSSAGPFSSLLSPLCSSPSSLSNSCSTLSSHSCQIFSEYRIVFCMRTTLSIFWRITLSASSTS